MSFGKIVIAGGPDTGYKTYVRWGGGWGGGGGVGRRIGINCADVV